MNNHLPKISVVIPCFNASPYLRECLNSVLNQTLSPFEVIVVDDGSTDSSPQVLAEYEGKIKVIHQKNQGVSQARNSGISFSQGDWIAIQDADDIWEPTKLEKQWEAIQNAEKNPICCYTDGFTFGAGVPTTHFSRPELCDKPFPIAEMLADWSVTSNAAMFSAKVKSRVKFPENIGDGEDDIFFALLRREGVFIKVKESLAGYRLHTGQATSKRFHALKKIESKLNWLEKNPILNSEESLIFKSEISRQINHLYLNAYWQRDWELAKLFQELHNRHIKHLGFEKHWIDRRLPPKFLILIKDKLHYGLKKVRLTLAPYLEQF